MKNIADIHEYLDEDSMILIVNNDDKELLDVVCNFIFRKHKGKKSTIKTGKGLYKKLCSVTDKFVKIDIDYKDLQFTSSKSRKRFELGEIRCKGVENNSKFLFRYDYKKSYDSSYYQYYWRSYFDLVMLIDDKKLKVIDSRYQIANKEFEIKQLVRNSKLIKLKQNFPF